MTASLLPSILAVSCDPGGANAVAPVIQALRCEKRVVVHALAYRQARTLWSKRNLAYEEISEDLTPTEAVERLRQSAVALLLTGTSISESSYLLDSEKQFLLAARESSVPSLSILDFWANYARRFSDAMGNLVYMPDQIAIMDERARDEMILAGFDPTRLVITGQPALDELILWKSKYNPAQRQVTRDILGVGPEEKLVVFASQPLAALDGTDKSDPHYFGYTEQTVLPSLAMALDQIADERRVKITLAVRPHPRESVNFLESLRCHKVRYLVTAKGESRDLVMAADLVTGMNSMLLLEACYLGCITVSLQPNLLLSDPLPTNHWGISRAVYQQEEIKPVVEQMLLDEQIRVSFQERLAGLRLDNNATRRVTDLIYQMLGLESGTGS